MNHKLLLGWLCAAAVLSAADYPAPVAGDWVVRDFRFHTGEVLPELRQHYATVGAPTGQPVLLLHGTGGSGAAYLAAGFAGEMFGTGQPLDAKRYYVIVPDSVGAGKSSKPSDGMRMKFPKYNYDDMVLAQYRLLTEQLGVKHLRLVMGTSGGGMQTWVWGEAYPDFMDALVPLASQPVQVAGRNWMLRRMMVETIKSDPEWNGGNYTQQPRGYHIAQTFFGLATSGGEQALYKNASTRAKADEEVERRLGLKSNGDANDTIYQYEASRDYNPGPKLETIQARLLAINSADDERNPPQLGVMEREIKRIKFGRFFLIPANENTRGHGTTGLTNLWKQQLSDLLLSTSVEAAR